MGREFVRAIAVIFIDVPLVPLEEVNSIVISEKIPTEQAPTHFGLGCGIIIFFL